MVMQQKTIIYCMFTTIARSLRAFVIPFAKVVSDAGYQVILGSEDDGKIADELPDDLSFLPLKVKRGFSFKGTILCTIQLYRYFRKNKISVVEYGTENVSFCASIAAWAARVPLRIYNHWGARYIGYTGFLRFFSFLIEKIIVMCSTVVRSCSEGNRQMTIEDGLVSEKKSKVVGYGGAIGVDLNKFSRDKKAVFSAEKRNEYGIGEQDFVFGYTGAIRRDKGSNELLTAFRAFSEGKDSVWLVLLGDVYEDDLIDADLYEWALQAPHVVFTGYVSDVEHYMAMFDCLLHPSYREGFGMVLAEAGAMGIPSITTRIYGAGEFAVEGVSGLLVNRADAEDLMEKMERVYADRAFLNSMSEEVYKLVLDRQDQSKVIRWHMEDRQELIRRYIG